MSFFSWSSGDDTLTRLEPMTVIRVETATGTRVEPPFSEQRSQTDKIRWATAVAALDSGLDIAIEVAQCSGYGPGPHYITVPGSTCGPYDYLDVTRVLSGIVMGAAAARRVDDPCR